MFSVDLVLEIQAFVEVQLSEQQKQVRLDFSNISQLGFHMFFLMLVEQVFEEQVAGDELHAEEVLYLDRVHFETGFPSQRGYENGNEFNYVGNHLVVLVHTAQVEFKVQLAALNQVKAAHQTELKLLQRLIRVHLELGRQQLINYVDLVIQDAHRVDRHNANEEIQKSFLSAILMDHLEVT